MTTDYTSDAAHFPGGHASSVAFPRSTADVVDVLATSKSVLPIGAQSSLTGGATPMGDVVLATSKMNRILDARPGSITVEPGVAVATIQEHLAGMSAWFPPVPTFTGAFAGGIVATNAAGAATFKYGSVRNWVEGLTVVLADGTVLDIARGTSRAQQGAFDIDTLHGRVRVVVPTYVMPKVAKRSAGYHAEPDMDLIDLFIGSEGTLGVVTRISFRTVSPAPNIVFAWIPCSSEPTALELAGALRDASMRTWTTHDEAGVDVCAIEHMDRRSLEIVKADGADRRNNVLVPAGTELALLVQLELRPDTDATRAFEQIQSSLGGAASDNPLGSFCRLLDRYGVLENAELALPGDRRRAAELLAIREAVPAGVNQRIGTAKRTIDDRIEKTAGDMVVPFERCAEMMTIYRDGFRARGLDYAIWGHISDGNVHPNVIAGSYEDVVKGKAAMLEFGSHVARLGGCPLAEHGVGRNAVKQALLQQLYGSHGIGEMRAVKQALDPNNRLAPGVIFPVGN